MSDVPTSSPRARRARRFGALRLAAAILTLLVVAVLALYLARRLVAKEVLISWLEARGVRSEVTFEKLDLDGAVARVRVGSPDDPELSIERVEADYRLRGFWSGRPLGADVSRVRLVRPVLRAAWRDGTLSLGSLDPVIEELRKLPPEPQAVKPLILIEDAKARLSTPYGAVALQGDARIADDKLERLEARLGPAVLGGDDFKAEVEGGSLSMVSRGASVDAAVSLKAKSLASGPYQADDATVSVTGRLPYPDLQAGRADGPVSLTTEAQIGQARDAEASARDVAVTANFDGRASGPFATVALAGPLQASLSAAQLEGADAKASGLKMGFAGQVRVAKADWLAQGTLSGATRGSWSGLGAPARGDEPAVAAVKRAAADFDLSAPALAVSASPRMLQLSVPAPVRVNARSGLTATLSSRPRSPLFNADRGAFNAQVRGGGAPDVDLAVERYRLTSDGLVANLSAKAAGSFGPAQDATIETAGALTLKNGETTYAAEDCRPVSIAKLEMGDNDVERLDASLCPADAPLLTISKAGAWRARGRLSEGKGLAPFLEARAEDVSADFDAKGRGETLGASLHLAAARLIDTAKETRFHPVRAAGEATMTTKAVSGAFQVSDGAGRALGKAELDTSLVDGSGGVTFDTGELTFAEGGLQPGALSPLAASMIASPTTGKARFEGGLHWAGETTTSQGVLTVPGLDFKSVAGPVAGLSGTVRFDSLIPLVTAPGQHLHVDRIDSMAALTNASLDFQLVDTELKIAAGSVDVGGGRVELEPATAPLDGKPFEGAAKIEGVQLAGIVAKSPFADRVSIDAKVSGRLPFVISKDGVRFIEGKLDADQPGRLSIHREALVDVAAKGGQAAVADGLPAPAAPQETNTVTEFAFQALEYLAFDDLAAEVNSLPNGRLGVLFKIQGAYEPPKEQDLKIRVGDLLKKDFLNRRLPLPSHTKVNLTLDTTLNLDQLLQDFAQTQRAGSGSVQP
ncbi:YdbH domain-containing protein [Phenylobacterium sp.]|uniref:intermembrane phospholipid transport protein YdbH family protein n=1 Tax=Phenylobacterium sp. TaxID=1871053 RepID=UPI0035B24E23